MRVKKMFVKVMLGLFLLALLLAAAAYCLPQDILAVDSGPVKADVIIVLGGGSHERPLRAAELFKDQAAPRIIITGAGDDQINRQLLLKAGVPATAIQIEEKSQTTRENAEFTRRLLQQDKVRRAILVTSWYHSRRALRTFEHFAPDVTFYSRPSYFAFDRDDWKRLGIYKRMRLEYLKLPGYWIRYGVCPF